MSESASSSGHSQKTKSNGEMSEAKSNELQQTTCQGHGKTNTTFQCVTNSSVSEVTKSTIIPKILLVEDNKINVMVTQSMMKQLGHSIDVVNNGVEAVRAVQRHTYDLILMVISRDLRIVSCGNFAIQI